ncbi:MAG: carbonic anhydrase family protein [Candidatus Ancillula sp.]|jgi:carbonic anhydrase|nr:carbonic anhydrase family protein [Candidatus Ancillula sp.]
MKCIHKIRSLAILPLLLLVLSSCSTQTLDQHSTVLDYSNQNAWKQVYGDIQSPIDIKTTSLVHSKIYGPITFYELDAESIINNGHSLEIEGSGKFKLSNTQYEFKQVHFHSPSEHTVDGKHYPLEAHFVSKSLDGQTSVVAVMFTEGAENNTFEQILELSSHEVQNTSTPLNQHLDLKKLLPENMSYWHYIGSLTTPPLTEGVNWYILKTPITVSTSQLEKFNSFYNYNNRNIQPLSDRSVIDFEQE